MSDDRNTLWAMLTPDQRKEMQQGIEEWARNLRPTWNGPAPAPVSDKGCELDTDGDGNCPVHPEGCPKPHPPADAALSEVLSRLLDGCGELPDDEIASRTALLAAFADRVRAEERERCARVAESCPALEHASFAIADRIRSLSPTGSDDKEVGNG